MANQVGTVQVGLYVGSTSLSRASFDMMKAFHHVRVQEDEDGPILFSIAFDASPGTSSSVYRPMVHDPNLQPFSRIAVTAALNNANADVLVDGFITQTEYVPGDTGQPGMYTVIGEDVSVMMSLQSPTAEHVNLSMSRIASAILGKYSKYGIKPQVSNPKLEDPLITRLQTVNDRRYLQELAAMCGYVFYIEPGPTIGSNKAVWGPRVTKGDTELPLNADLGPDTLIEALKFEYRALDPFVVKAQTLDISGKKAQVVELTTSASSETALSAIPALTGLGSNARSGNLRHAGMAVAHARMIAQGKTDNQTANALVASGRLSVLRYGDILHPRRLAAVRGAGFTYDGSYRIKRVLHEIGRGYFDQSFTLAREGLESKSNKVST